MDITVQQIFAIDILINNEEDEGVEMKYTIDLVDWTDEEIEL